MTISRDFDVKFGFGCFQAETKRCSLIRESRHLEKMKKQLEVDLLSLQASSDVESSTNHLERRLEEANQVCLCVTVINGYLQRRFILL